MNAETQAAEWVAREFPTHKRPKYGENDFSENDMEIAFLAGYVAGIAAAQDIFVPKQDAKL